MTTESSYVVPRHDWARVVKSTILARKVEFMIVVLIVLSFLLSTHATGVWIAREQDTYNISSTRKEHDEALAVSKPIENSLVELPQQSSSTMIKTALEDRDTVDSASEGSSAAIRSAYQDFPRLVKQSKSLLSYDDNDTRSLQHVLVYTGVMKVHVKLKEMNTFQNELEEVVNNIGQGYYQEQMYYSDNSSLRKKQRKSLELTARILSDHFEETIQHIQVIVENVEFIRISSHDMAFEIVDTKARTELFEAARESLQTLMKNAHSVEEVLALQAELNRLREQAEWQRQQASFLQNQISYSTLMLEVDYIPLTTKKPSTVDELEKWHPMSSVAQAWGDVGCFFRSALDAVLYFSVWIFTFFVLCMCIGCLADNDSNRIQGVPPKDPV